MITRLLESKCLFLPPRTHNLFILWTIVSTVTANKVTSITTFQDTNTNEVDISKLVPQIAKKNISHLMPFTVQRVSVSSLTVTQKRTKSNRSSSQIWVFLPMTLHFAVILDTTRLAISQNHTLNFLKFIFFLELGQNLMKRNQCFIQRSA